MQCLLNDLDEEFPMNRIYPAAHLRRLILASIAVAAMVFSTTAPVAFAETDGMDRRQDRRGDRQDNRDERGDDRRDCRQEEGVGKDKRDCKQDERQDRRHGDDDNNDNDKGDDKDD